MHSDYQVVLRHNLSVWTSSTIVLSSLALLHFQNTTWGKGRCEWLPGDGVPGVNGQVNAMTRWDPDGPGGEPESLVVAGRFTAAGSSRAGNLAFWDGTSWSAPGEGLDNEVFALAIFDDGTGPALYAGGRFYRAGGLPAKWIARWDGSSWSPVGSGLSIPSPQSWADGVRALAVYNDGTGPALYAAGTFTIAGEVPVHHVARWDGASWSAVGAGTNDAVDTLAVFDDGTGPALYAGGNFSQAGEVNAAHTARWNGTSWSAVGDGVDGPVHALLPFDDGNGPRLYIGGEFSTAGGTTAENIAAWDGALWFPLGSGHTSTVRAMVVYDDGSGPAIHAGSIGVSRWDGASWSAVGTRSSETRALAVIDHGAGSFLYAGATSTSSYSFDSISVWDGSSWASLGTGTNGEIEALAQFDDGTGPAIYAGGHFTTIGGVPANAIARWDGISWSPLGTGVRFSSEESGFVRQLAVFDDGAGPALFVSGGFFYAGNVPTHGIARWDGTSWHDVGTFGVTGPVHAMTVFDDGTGPALYLGGWFTSIGGVRVNNVARWNGTEWSPVGEGVRGSVQSLVVHDDGSGPALFASDLYPSTSGTGAAMIAKWDGSSWQSIGPDMPRETPALASFDAGDGPALYAGGWFQVDRDGAFTTTLIKWNGTDWHLVEQRMQGSIQALAVFDDGGGPSLFAGGFFRSVDQVMAANIAQWDGRTWSAMGKGLNESVSVLAGFNEGSGRTLYAAGRFTTAGDHVSAFLARWHCESTAEACPLEDVLGRTRNGAAHLQTLRSFRDQVLARSRTGREYIAAYYRHADEVQMLLRGDPLLRRDATLLILELLPLVQRAAGGEQVRLEPGQRMRLEKVLRAMEAGASDELKEVLHSVRNDLSENNLPRVGGASGQRRNGESAKASR